MDRKSPPSRWSAVARALVAGLAMLMGLIASMACIWRPDAWAALALVPPWCWLMAGLLSAALVWRIRQARFAAALAGFWIVFAIGWVEEVRSFARLAGRSLPGQRAPSGQPLRVVSLNCAGSERCLADLRLVDPDIVLLQEAPVGEALVRMTAGLYGEAGEYCTAGDVAILAGGSIRKEADEDGLFVSAAVRLADGREVQCTSLRLAPPPSRLDPWTTGFWTAHRQFRQLHRRQVAEILEAAGNRNAPAAILGGDFNTLPLDAALDGLRREFADSFSRCGVGWGATGTNDWPLFRVDQIWTSGRLAPIQTFARKTDHSDHRMVVCDVVVRQ